LAEKEGESFSLPETMPEYPEYPDPVAKFREEFEALEGIFFDTGSRKEIRAALQQVLLENEAGSLAWENEQVLDMTGCSYSPGFQFSSEDFFTCSLHEDGTVSERVTLTNFDRTSEEMGRMEVSVSKAKAGIAETGSIVESIGEKGSRVMPILAPVHVVLLPADRLLNNHLDFFTSFTPGAEGSAQIIMSGASRTGDIEKTLIVGVHGPKKLYVIFMRESSVCGGKSEIRKSKSEN
ncbi:MAG: LUD domain-containing protein, partial [Acidobacteriota bacterium]